MDNTPLTGFTRPSRESSPAIRYPFTISWVRMPSAISMPMAIGRSKADPSFLISAGARLTTTCLSGKSNPVFLRAARTRSLLSLTAASGRPTVEKKGSPLLAMSTSTSTG